MNKHELAKFYLLQWLAERKIVKRNKAKEDLDEK